jgi:H+/gluconate symporter-like permease
MAFLFVLFNMFKVNIIVCLIFSILLSTALFWKQLRPKNFKDILSKGAAESIPMTMTVGAICGFATIITSSEAFQIILKPSSASRLLPSSSAAS